VETFAVVIRTPEGPVADTRAEALVAPGLSGYYGILARHAPMVGSVSRGLLRLVAEGGGRESYVVGDGVLRVGENRVEVLVEHAARAADAAGAEEDLEKYLKDLARSVTVLTADEDAARR
jgi:F-type H+-transporting ATPase subunit epsilon